MSEREGLYCEKHVKWCADGVCADCAPAEQRPWSWLINQRAITISGLDLLRGLSVAELAPLEPRFAQAVASLVRPCNHANGYCKDTAHKYELPTETIPETPTQKKTRAALIGCGLAALADWHWTPVE